MRNVLTILDAYDPGVDAMADLDHQVVAIDLDLAAGTVREAERLTLSEDPTFALSEAIRAAEALDDAIVGLVALMRREGASWADVAASAGVSRSGAHRKWAHLLD